MSDSGRSLDDVAEELRESGSVRIEYDTAEGGAALEGAAGLLTGLAELDDFDAHPSEVVIELRR